jgi:hypothetical protein
MKQYVVFVCLKNIQLYILTDKFLANDKIISPFKFIENGFRSVLFFAFLMHPFNIAKGK